MVGLVRRAGGDYNGNGVGFVRLPFSCDETEGDIMSVELAGADAVCDALIAAVAEDEQVSEEFVRAGVRTGSIILMGGPGTASRALATDAMISRLDSSIEPAPSFFSISVVRRTAGSACCASALRA